MQHYNTMLSRFRGFPVKIEMLSRFVSKKDQDDTKADIKSGKADIVVGTHKLLQKDIEFRSLGLLIIDEEQRFGVTHKEKLKMLSENVDSLTLTATPIPRTLNMALSGIRDMSGLEEAPSGQECPVAGHVCWSMTKRLSERRCGVGSGAAGRFFVSTISLIRYIQKRKSSDGNFLRRSSLSPPRQDG